MKQKHLVQWITLAGIIGMLFGVFYTIFGLEGLPVYEKFVPASSLAGWSRGLYGAAFIGFSVLLLLVGRRALQTNDDGLKKIALWGIASWLAFEALISLVYGVYINIVVDVALLVFLSFPLVKKTRK